jgi:hypothetical protein
MAGERKISLKNALDSRRQKRKSNAFEDEAQSEKTLCEAQKHNVMMQFTLAGFVNQTGYL